MEVSEIEAHTRREFADFEHNGALSTHLIDRSGSGRRFVRFCRSTGASVIAMHYSTARRENCRFVEITRFLDGLGVPVPQIRSWCEARQLVWLEDLGAADLEGMKGDDWDTARAPLYRAALDAVFPLHRCPESAPPENLPDLEPGFDAALYRWEQGYFFENFAALFSDCPAERLAEIRESAELAQMAERLGSLPRRLIHRDFQSSNIMIHGGRPWLIDYQGMRWGLPEYDLAALLYDPYVCIEEAHREGLAWHYYGLKATAGDGESWEDFSLRLRQCAAQRLMQALGAYGNLGLNKGQTIFLKHIPAALSRLREIAVAQKTIPALAPALSLKESRVA